LKSENKKISKQIETETARKEGKVKTKEGRANKAGNEERKGKKTKRNGGIRRAGANL
jgi:hypothetical protein